MDGWHRGALKLEPNVPAVSCIHVMTHKRLTISSPLAVLLPKYPRVVVDFCPSKRDPNHVRIIMGENPIKYLGELTTKIVEM